MSISFSVIMPTYNRKDCIKNAIESLLKQTYQDFELIIIDDGSTDKTENYLKDVYKEEISIGKIKILRLSENKGVCFARNEGLKLAKNEWISYLDTDNKMHSDFLSTFVNFINENKNKKIFYSQIQTSRSNRVIGCLFDFKKIIIENYIDLGSFVHSIEIYHEIGGFDLKLSRLVDWDLIIRYTEKYEPVFIEKVLLDYDDSLNMSRISVFNSLSDNYKMIILNYYRRNGEKFPEKRFEEEYSEFYCKIIKEEERQKKEYSKTLEIKEEELRILEKQLLSKNHELSEIYNSVAWNMVVLIRKFLCIIFPLKSLRRRVAVFIFKFCEKIIEYFLNKIIRVYAKIKPFYLKIICWFKKVFNSLSFSLIHKFIFNDNLGPKDITVVLHLYYTDMWPYIMNKLKNIPYEYNLVISLTDGHFDKTVIEEIKKYKIDSKIFIFENKGMDILPFLKCLKYIPKTTKYLLKIHTKKSPQNSYGSIWFKDLIDNALSNKLRILMILNSLKNTNIGMIGGCVARGFRYGGLLDNNQFYEKKIELIEDYYMNNNLKYKWIAGTMFWVNFDIVNNFDDNFIKFFEKEQPLGYSIDGTIAHGLERYFGRLVYENNKIISINPKRISIFDYVKHFLKK